ncbi:uncharacterized protein RHOBADRAFT_66822, partial [Rhodotorula graminis WP1]
SPRGPRRPPHDDRAHDLGRTAPHAVRECARAPVWLCRARRSLHRERGGVRPQHGLWEHRRARFSGGGRCRRCAARQGGAHSVNWGRGAVVAAGQRPARTTTHSTSSAAARRHRVLGRGRQRPSLVRERTRLREEPVHAAPARRAVPAWGRHGRALSAARGQRLADPSRPLVVRRLRLDALYRSALDLEQRQQHRRTRWYRRRGSRSERGRRWRRRCVARVARGEPRCARGRGAVAQGARRPLSRRLKAAPLSLFASEPTRL